MYFPYLRGKRFEMFALLEVPIATYNNMLPIVEPVAAASATYFTRMAQQGRPFVLIMNPYHPQSGRLPMSRMQAMLTPALVLHAGLHLGYIIDQHASAAELQAFLASNPGHEKVVIFRHTPLATNMPAYDRLLQATPPKFLVFDETKSRRLRPALSWHPRHVMLVDGFERQERNADYPPLSNFSSNVTSWRSDGLVGMGDYLNNGDYFREGGSQPKVITLHLTGNTPYGLVVHHFSSTVSATVAGAAGPKFSQANGLLVASPDVGAMPVSSGIQMFQQWNAASHLPHLGAAKQASMQHHMELMAQLV